MPNIVFSAEDVTGHVENDDEIWLHSRTRNTADDEIKDREEKATLIESSDDNCREENIFRRNKDDDIALHVMDQGQESTSVHIHSNNEAGSDENVNETIDTKEEDKESVVKEIIHSVTQLVKDKARKPRITFLDFAGQGDYYAFHQIYLSPQTFYILVVDMSKKFDHENKLDEECGSRFTSWKYKGYRNVCAISYLVLQVFFTE